MKYYPESLKFHLFTSNLTFLVCAASLAINVFPQSFLSNSSLFHLCFKQRQKIEMGKIPVINCSEFQFQLFFLLIAQPYQA